VTRTVESTGPANEGAYDGRDAHGVVGIVMISIEVHLLQRVWDGRLAVAGRVPATNVTAD
jgi:hypothetical protein